MTKSRRSKAMAEAGSGHALPTTVGIVNHDPTRHRAPGYSFGSRPHERDRARAPGPQYSLDNGLTPRGTGYSPSFSITGRPRRTVWDSMVSKAPGPSTYTPNIHDPGEKSAPIYSFGRPYRQEGRRQNLPAPNTYTLPGTLGPNVPVLKSGPASSMHRKAAETKGFSYDFARTPGPAKYGPVDLSHTMKRAPAATMKGRTKLPSLVTATKSPGPADYDPGSSLDKVSSSSPRLRLRVRYHDSLRPPLFTMTDVSH
ncbi:ciliary microtubule associated protein 1B-like isoform X2 [Babylonia areolata]|uniref:ciliary microtubule associated protein 1B-like isoform X2 n=1 Tax=Babylonia areolata TaxID=304850 RepID=UPI003FCFC160